MSDYVASQKNISVTYDSDIEVITSDLQKLQFTSSGQLTLSRPDKLRASRTGGYTDVEFVFDGKTFTVFDRDNKAYAQSDATGSIAQLVERLRSEYFVEAPGADLLLAGSYDILTENVTDAKHIGLGVINGVECEHLAYRTPDTDWQIWVEVGDRPIPRKYVITNKAVTGGPQYTLRHPRLENRRTARRRRLHVQCPSRCSENRFQWACTDRRNSRRRHHWRKAMSSFATRFLQAVLATVVAAGCFFLSDRALMTREGLFVAAAEARVGRPLTPVSYAGVARRTTRRAVAVGAVAAPVVVAPVARAAFRRSTHMAGCIRAAIEPTVRIETTAGDHASDAICTTHLKECSTCSEEF